MCWCERANAAWLEHILRFWKFAWNQVFSNRKKCSFLGWRTRSEAFEWQHMRPSPTKLAIPNWLAECLSNKTIFCNSAAILTAPEPGATQSKGNFADTFLCFIAIIKIGHAFLLEIARIEFIEKCNVWITRNQLVRLSVKNDISLTSIGRLTLCGQ